MLPQDEPISAVSPAFSLEDSALAIFWMITLGFLCTVSVSATDWSESTRGIVGTMAVETGLLFGVIVILKRKHLSLVQAFGLQAGRWPRAIGAGLAGCLVLAPITLMLSTLTTTLFHWLNIPEEEQPAIQWILDRKDLPFRIAFCFQAALAAPFVEELFFRGVLLQSFRSRFSVPISVIATSLLFALFHFHAPSFLPLFALAAGFAAVCLITRSLAAAWVMHAAYNIANLLLILT
jgi:membrane protease YdiL (CAAX protease family)